MIDEEIKISDINNLPWELRFKILKHQNVHIEDLKDIKVPDLITLHDRAVIGLRESSMNDDDKKYNHSIHLLQSTISCLENRGIHGRLQTKFNSNPIKVNK